MLPGLYRYWLREFARFFFIIELLILTLFILIDYLSRLDKFLNSDLTLIGAFGYVLLKVPFMFVQLTPAAVLLSAICVFGLMNRNNELLAIRSSGISIYLLVKPALMAGGVLALFMFLLGETLIPVTMAKANFINTHVIKKKQGIHTARQDIWIKSENQLVHINYFDPVNQRISGVTITILDREFNMVRRLDAAQADYTKDGQWELKDVIMQEHQPDTLDYNVTVHDVLTYPLAFDLADLGEVAKKSDEMSFFELRRYAAKVAEEGYDNKTYQVDMNGKLAFPFICIIMILTGAATGMRKFAKENIPVAVALGVVVAFLYWVMHGFCLSLGYGGILPPIVSAWAANLFFAGFGTLFLMNAE